MNTALEPLLAQLKLEKSTKGEIASQFKNTAKNSADYLELMAAMKNVSARIDALNAQIKALTTATICTNIHANIHTDQDASSLSASTQTETRSTQALINSDRIAPKISPFLRIAETSHWNKVFSIKLLEADDLNRWDEFLKQYITTYHNSVWLDLIKKSFGHESCVLAAIDENGNLLGGLPLTFFSSTLFGKFAVSIPFLNYGGVISLYFDIAQALIKYTQVICTEKNLSHIEIRTTQAGLSENSLDKKVSMVLELPQTNAALEQQLGAKVRAQYKKAEAYLPSSRVGKMELLNDFYRVFAQNMRDLGTPVYSKKWFANILIATNIKSAIVVVYMNQEPVSAGFLVGNDIMLEIPWASTIQRANVKNANMWMYRQILAYAITEGYAFFDFGRSTMGAGTYKFKKQWGAQPYQHHWYYILADGKAKPELNPDNPKFKLFIFMWKLMPVWLTNILGPFLIKNIP